MLVQYQIVMDPTSCLAFPTASCGYFLKRVDGLETKHFQEPLLEAKSRLELDQLGISMVDQEPNR